MGNARNLVKILQLYRSTRGAKLRTAYDGKVAKQKALHRFRLYLQIKWDRIISSKVKGL